MTKRSINLSFAREGQNTHIGIRYGDDFVVVNVKISRPTGSEVPGNGLDKTTMRSRMGSHVDTLATFHSFISLIVPLVILLNAQPCGRLVCSSVSHHCGTNSLFANDISQCKINSRLDRVHQSIPSQDARSRAG